MRRLVAVMTFIVAAAAPLPAAAQEQAPQATPLSLARRPAAAVRHVRFVGAPPEAPQEAADGQPVQLALFFPVQLFPETEAIRGVRLNLIYGRNTDVTGLDVGLVNYTTRSFLGVQWGVVGIAEGSFTGWQANWLVNVSKGTFEGVQWGALVNSAEAGRGGQVAGVNVAQNYRGLQLGLVNYAESLNGFQVGFVNIIKHGGAFPVMVLVNWGKDTKLPE